MWVEFWDMYSGGHLKLEPYEQIYIEASSIEEAIEIFYNKFGIDPYNITCSCCGIDYEINSHESLKQLTAFHRNCEWSEEKGCYIEKPDKYGEYISLRKYLRRPDVLVIRKKKKIKLKKGG